MPEFIRNCFNYVGGKDKLLKQIYENVDLSNADNSTFMDVFSGSGIVGVNMSEYFRYVHLNDACWQVIHTIEYFRDKYIGEIIEEVEYWIDLFGLSKTNKQGYLNARAAYNADYKDISTFKPALFYALLTHSFSYNITFNSKREFNVPAGTNRSNFNSSIREKLYKYQNLLSKNWVTTASQDFRDILDMLRDAVDDLSDYFFYFDPPYYNSDAVYSRIYGLKWTEHSEHALYEQIDEINESGGKFLLSNTVENNGITNEILKKWMKKYNVIEVDMSYKGCSYQRKNNGKTKEILVRNY